MISFSWKPIGLKVQLKRHDCNSFFFKTLFRYIAAQMRRGLSSNSWEVVNVSFNGINQRFLANSTIQASILQKLSSIEIQANKTRSSLNNPRTNPLWSIDGWSSSSWDRTYTRNIFAHNIKNMTWQQTRVDPKLTCAAMVLRNRTESVHRTEAAEVEAAERRRKTASRLVFGLMRSLRCEVWTAGGLEGGRQDHRMSQCEWSE